MKQSKSQKAPDVFSFHKPSVVIFHIYWRRPEKCCKESLELRSILLILINLTLNRNAL